MTMQALDIDAIRAFVTIADLKSFTKAAIALDTTQATLSLRLKRLEQRIDRKLVERTPRHVKLSSQGEMFIESARNLLQTHDQAIETLFAQKNTLKLGISCHLIGPELQTILAKIHTLHPHLSLEISTQSANLLQQSFAHGELDAIIISSHETRKQGTELCIEHYSWYASKDFRYTANEPLKLAVLEESCGVRDQAAAILSDAGIPSQNVFIGGNIDVVSAAISAGMAIGVFSQRLAPKELIDVGEKFHLPELPTSSIELHTDLTDQATRQILNDIGSVFRDNSAA